MGDRAIRVGVELLSTPPLALLRRYVLLARAIGLDSVVVEDHLQEFWPRALWDRRLSWMAALNTTPHNPFDFQVLLGHLAARLGRVRVGVCVTEPSKRHPVVIAQALLTLAHMTRRPPILGVGAGERMNVEPYGLDFSHPVGRLEEALEVIRLCLTSTGPVDYAGRHFRLDGAVMDLSAPPGRTPEVWVAAHGPRGLRLTGRLGDGWVPTPVGSPDTYAGKLTAVREAALDAGRDPDAITASLYQPIIVAPTERQARALLATPLVRFTALTRPGEVWSRHGEHHPFGDDFGGYADLIPERLDRLALEDALAAVPLSVVAEETGLWGTPERIAEQLRAYGAAGLQHVNIAPLSALISRRGAAYSVYALRRIASLLADAKPHAGAARTAASRFFNPAAAVSPAGDARAQIARGAADRRS